MSETVRKILNDSNPTAQQVKLGDAVAYAPVRIVHDITADYTGNPVVFTATFPMRIVDIHVIATATVGGGTVTPKKGSDAICTAIACATDQALARMSAGVDDTKLTFAVGDTLNLDTANANDRGIVIIDAYRL